MKKLMILMKIILLGLKVDKRVPTSFRINNKGIE